VPLGPGKRTILRIVCHRFGQIAGASRTARTYGSTPPRRLCGSPMAPCCGYVFPDSRLFPHPARGGTSAYGLTSTPSGTEGDRTRVAPTGSGYPSSPMRGPPHCREASCQRVALARALAPARTAVAHEHLSALDASPPQTQTKTKPLEPILHLTLYSPLPVHPFFFSSPLSSLCLDR